MAGLSVRGGVLGIIVGALLGLSAAPAAAAPGPLSEQALLWRLADPAAQLSALPPGVSVTQLSSHDMTGGNLDGGSYNQTVGQTALPPTHSLGRHHRARRRAGPGCLTRMWMTGDTNGTQGDPGSFGNLPDVL